jgi:hypothetical protein
MGPGRSLPKLAEQHGESTEKARKILQRQYEKWSSQHNWQERVKFYDAERAEVTRAAHDAEIDAMNERHATIGTTQQTRALEQIKALVEAKAFGSMAAVQLLKLATDIERVARGAPTDRQEVTGADGTAIAGVIVYLPDNGRTREVAK